MQWRLPRPSSRFWRCGGRRRSVFILSRMKATRQKVCSGTTTSCDPF
ncbi:unnamed protein product [Linum tenue]|uniref:Uncharacterized protein n=1 Tax=Linum tenue TaxID=586396 RepID=A0AAV0IZ67_9ROSI|nr:unnamed protein product [Linum tenue]